jgi:hypothetical protein
LRAPLVRAVDRLVLGGHRGLPRVSGCNDVSLA